MLTPETVRTECVVLACGREAAVIRRRMQRGLASLASIAATAALVGFIGSAIGIIVSFRGISGENSRWLTTMATDLSRALIPGGLGLAVALEAIWIYNDLCGRIETLDQEVRIASLEFVNELTAAARRADILWK